MLDRVSVFLAQGILWLGLLAIGLALLSLLVVIVLRRLHFLYSFGVFFMARAMGIDHLTRWRDGRKQVLHLVECAVRQVERDMLEQKLPVEAATGARAVLEHVKTLEGQDTPAQTESR